MMSDCYVGEIIMWAPPYAPEGWLFCDGATVAIDNYELLYAVIGTTYGGSGDTSFMLPDLRGRVPVHQGQAPGLQNYMVGMLGGVTDVVLSTQQLPSHTHALTAAGVPGDANAPAAGYALSTTGPQDGAVLTPYAPPTGPQVTLAPTSIGTFGDSQAHSNMQPSLAINYIICYAGIFPTPD